MLIRNSSLSLVFSKRSFTKSIASIGFISARYLRRIHMRSSVCLSCSKSSRRVLEATILTAGKMRLLDRLRSSCSSILPVPLNSSKITSSILLPVSTNAVASIVKLPPFSKLRAAPKNYVGLCNAAGSKPPESVLPDGGITKLYALASLVILSNKIITSLPCSVSLFALSSTISATFT